MLGPKDGILVAIVTIMITIPITILVPASVVAIPPPVVRVPAAFPLGIQIAPPLIRLVAALAVLANRLVELHLSAFDVPLALGMVGRVGICPGRGNEYGRA